MMAKITCFKDWATFQFLIHYMLQISHRIMLQLYLAFKSYYFSTNILSTDTMIVDGFG